MPQRNRPQPHRHGPRPLPLHLLTQAAILSSWPAGLNALNSGSPIWRPSLATRAEALHRELAAVAPDQLTAAIDAEARRRLGAFLDGVEAYHRHPYRRNMPEVPVVWQDGATRLLDYGHDREAPAVLVVPSLVNRYYVLDLRPRRSLVRYLAARGLRPLVVDWGAPGEAEANFSLDDYIAGRLEAMLDIASGGGTAAVLGYCMGGLLAVALAARCPRRVNGLALLATPWDFHAGPEGGPALKGLERWLGAATAGGLPVDALQAMFAAVDPTHVVRKFQSFAQLSPTSAAARDFVALEDWLNDGVPLVGKVAQQCLGGWYIENEPGRDAWQVGGIAVQPEAITAPALVLVPGRDRIVPPQSALSLGQALPRARVRIVDAGHIGMVAGRAATTKVYAPLAKWLRHVALQPSACALASLPVKTRIVR